MKQTETKIVFLDKTDLFATHPKSQKKPSKDAIRPWILEMLGRSGVDTFIYTSYSTRHTFFPKTM